MLTAADVNSLYPSIQLDRGMSALRWFMDKHTSFNQTLKDLCLKLAYFVLTNNYVECKELGDTIYCQRIGTAMGTSFSVVYALHRTVRLETPILEDGRFRPCIRLYKRYIDDLFLIWTGSAALLCEFRLALGSADSEISLSWNGYSSAEDAVNPQVVGSRKHDQVDFLDLDMRVEHCFSNEKMAMDTSKIVFRPYRKPGNAYAYIPFNSFHGRHTFRGWIMAKLLRLATNSSSPEIWLDEGMAFYHWLRSRGYPRWSLDLVFKKVTWQRRTQILNGVRKQTNAFFDEYRVCELTLRNAPEWPMLKEHLDLSLKEVVQSHVQGHFSTAGLSGSVKRTSLGINS